MARVKVTEVIALPADPDALEAFDWEAYGDKRRRLPGLERLELSRVVAPPGGGAPDAALISEGWFRDLDTLRRAHGSAEGTAVRESVAALRELTDVVVHVSVLEDASPPPPL